MCRYVGCCGANGVHFHVNNPCRCSGTSGVGQGRPRVQSSPANVGDKFAYKRSGKRPRR